MPLMKNVMIAIHKRTGDRFAGMDLLYLTTVGARTGRERVSPMARFADGDGAWLVVASNNGGDRHPAWYHNLRAHPDQVTVEIGGRRVPARAEELTGAERDAAMQRIAAGQPRFGQYERKTTRTLPVIRLSAR
ncbi:nitroreductase family deazaflavin-dependent oxidoreductase [Dactylosporangium sp. AC04546]|uniref:nitroreductase family deazaflavin-dependent oxidoreductase n=1 Tax=Dactylosporangium sp. AC04546 TaxID=2862460 RepID=UPI001EDE0054|nr:nitroreductase family deazaflavin-dependent oxidoreductase [Dactylosporangium sp. AC04546]WVK78716.1 nitroreductase family deazaflavin-dependent oxidoreductase [Dactylosporangium sp. AC04546]